MKRAWCYIVMMMGLLLSFSMNSRVFAASAPAVTSLAVATGRDGTSILEGQGYEVIYTNFNAGVAEQNVYIGYKRGGGTPITDLRISEQNQGSITVDGINYTAVSGANLNAGSSGSAIFLYATTDSRAGTGILDFTPNADNENYALTSDGAVPVRKDSGETANLEQGKGQSVYLMMVKEDIFQPYINEVHIACEVDKGSAISRLSAIGCDYYLDTVFPASDGRIMMIGYNRTSQEAEALTACVEFKAKAATAYLEDGLTINGVEYQPVDQEQWESYGRGIFVTKDPEAGMPIQDLLEGDMDGYSKPVSEWARGLALSRNYSLASCYMMDESTYQDALEDGTDLLATGMLFVSGKEQECGSFSYFAVEGEVSASPWEVDPAEFLTEDGDENSEDEDEKSDEAVADENEEQLSEGEMLMEIDMDTLEPDQKDIPEESSGEEGVPEAANTGSVFGSNSISVLVTLGIGILLAMAGIVFYRKQKSGDDKRK